MSPERSPGAPQKSTGEGDSLSSIFPEDMPLTRKEWWNINFPGRKPPKMKGEKRARTSKQTPQK